MSFPAVRVTQHCKHFSRALTVLLLALPLLGFTPHAAAQTGQKVVEGKVVGSSNQPQPGAIVYLKNTKSGDIKSFISVADGTYRFGQLSPDVDYEIWAEYNGRKSTTKMVSSFDSKKLLDYQLKVDTGK
jgi:hypothetical protein